MRRTFLEHRVRPVVSLDGRWDFVTATQRAGRDRGRLPARFPGSIQVPSVWEMIPGLENYRGKAWFRTHVPRLPGRAMRLLFNGVSHTADVFLDGRHIGHHYDAFTPFDVVAPASDRADTAELIVQVDNSFGDHSALHLENDYYTYGGITRPTEVQWLPDLFIERVHAVPAMRRGKWDLMVRVRLRNCGRKPVRRRVVVQLDRWSLTLGPVTVAAGASREVSGTLAALEVEPWSAASPRLYTLTAHLLDGQTVVDDLIDRVGFRQVQVRGKQVLLNGKSVRFRGYNRHEEYAHFGCAVPLEAMAHDLELMRDLGCNFVRTCHYPNDQRFLDLCDELGFYVWEESHARQVKFDHPRFREQIEASTREMVDWHHNHACIVMWGCLNECETRTPAGRAEYARVIRLIRKLDPSRPITYATMFAKDDICYDLADIVSWNRYDGWYRPEHGTKDIEPMLKQLLKHLHSPASRGGKGKPVILSEFGAAALYGYRDPVRPKYSEEYQADVLDESLRVYLNHPDVVGAAIWQFCDVRVTLTRWRDRPRTHNNKGTVDEYRRRKLAYDVVKRRMHEAAKRHD